MQVETGYTKGMYGRQGDNVSSATAFYDLERMVLWDSFLDP